MKSDPKFTSALRGVLLVTAGYLFIYQLWYSGQPMGLDPVLDGKQNLLIAEKIHEGASFDQPFHRAPLYPFLISLARHINILDLPVPLVARGMNSFFVLVTVFFTCQLAWLIWKKKYAVWFAGIAVGCNPVVLFFAGDPLDITIATSCLVIACWTAYRSYRSRRFRWELYLIGSLAIGAGMAMRSHLLLVGILWPFMLGLAATRNKSTRKPNYIGIAFALGIIGPALSFLGVGMANKAVSGEFRMTPWGGAYLLWAGNDADLNNGRYYKQTVDVDYEDGEYQNPTILESIYYYVDETREEPPYDISAMNEFFIDGTIDNITDDPVTWMGLMLRKFHSLVHNYEQYDNKTFSLQKYESPFLRFNPIGWGLLFLAAALGGCLLISDRKSSFWGLMLIIGLYGIMVLSTFTANRYRVPLIPLLAVMAAGLPKLYFRSDRVSKRQKVIMVYVGGVVATLTFIPFFGIAAKDTYLADYALMANAAHRRGFDKDAVEWSDLALEIDSSREDMLEIKLVSQFNTWYGYGKNWVITEWAEKHLEDIEESNKDTEQLTYIRGVYLWKLGRHEEACRFWKHAFLTFDDEDSAFALVWNCDLSEEELNQLPESTRRKAAAIRNKEIGFKESPDTDPYTAETIRDLGRFYLFAFEPFKDEE